MKNKAVEQINDPVDDEELVIRSLPDPSAHSIASIRSLILSTGSWEQALETLLEQEYTQSVESSPSPSSSPAPIPSGSSSPLNLDLIPERPQSPKRTLSASTPSALIHTPPSQRMRLMSRSSSESSLSELSEEEDEHPKVDISASPPTDEEVSDFEKQPKAEQTAAENDVKPRYHTRSRTNGTVAIRPKPLSGRERKEVARQRKRDARYVMVTFARCHR